MSLFTVTVWVCEKKLCESVEYSGPMAVLYSQGQRKVDPSGRKNPRRPDSGDDRAVDLWHAYPGRSGASSNNLETNRGVE